MHLDASRKHLTPTITVLLDSQGRENVLKTLRSRNHLDASLARAYDLDYHPSVVPYHGGCMPEFIPFNPITLSEGEQLQRARDFFELCRQRRSIREFSDRPIPKEVLDLVLRTAGSAPSGANKQPWRFVVVTDPELKRKIRAAAEAEEKQSYEHRMPQEWLDDLAALGTDWHKEFLEVAPALIVVFSIAYTKDGEKLRKNYYVKESVGIASGFLLAAIHNAGLVSLTHTPSPMDFLQKILLRPDNEKAFLLIPVGYPKEGTVVPNIQRKEIEDFVVWR